MSAGSNNPYDPTQLAVVTTVSSAHRVIGVLNIIFACLLSLCGFCTAVNVGMQYAMAPMLDQQQRLVQESMTARMQEQRDREIEALEASRDTAATEDDRAAIEAEIQARQNAPLPQAPNLKMAQIATNATITVYTLVDALSGLTLNVGMFVAGVGLLGSREWARRLGVWVAGLKICRLLVVYATFLAFVVPEYSRMTKEMFDEMAKVNPGPGGGPPPNMPDVGMIYAVMMTVFGVAMIVLGSVYPAISLWILTRPGVKLACGAPVSNDGPTAQGTTA